MKCTIFGKNIGFNFSNEKVSKILEKELSIYKPSGANEEVDVNVNFVDCINYKGTAFISPASHTTFRKGFLANYGICKVLYLIEDNKLNISVEVTAKNIFLKILNYEYKTNFDLVGTLLHELVLVPMIYFYKDLAIIHSSAFKNNRTGEVFVVGGTGGVGKTTLELLFCKKEGYSFISDDIAIVNADGYIYPNLSFPKIYAYNTILDKGFEEFILSSDTFIEKVHWIVMKKLRGANKVRRRVCPVKLYRNVENEKLLITKYFILLKSDGYHEIKKEKIKKDDVGKLTQLIIKNEYHSFHQHIVWHEFNCIANGLKPILSINNVFEEKNNIIDRCFKRVDSNYIFIPKDMSHRTFVENIEEFFI